MPLVEVVFLVFCVFLGGPIGERHAYSFVSAGVPGLRTYLRHRFPRAFQTLPRTHAPLVQGSAGVLRAVDHLCVDMNYLLHTHARRTGFAVNPSFSRSLLRSLQWHWRQFSPRRSMVLAVDGCAPFAKLQTQILRRRESPESAPLTPGTDLMREVDRLLASFACQQENEMLSAESLTRNVTFFLSGSSQGGEGELKILQWIQHHCKPLTHNTQNYDSARISSYSCNASLTHNGDAALQKETIVLCGLDSDLLLQALSLTRHFHVFVHGLHLGQSLLCDVNDLVAEMDFLLSEKDVKCGEQLSERERETLQRVNANRCADIVLLFALMGNDYLPKLRVSRWDRLLQGYKDAMSSLRWDEAFIFDTQQRNLCLRGLRVLLESSFCDSAEVVTSLLPTMSREFLAFAELNGISTRFTVCNETTDTPLTVQLTLNDSLVLSIARESNNSIGKRDMASVLCGFAAQTYFPTFWQHYVQQCGEAAQFCARHAPRSTATLNLRHHKLLQSIHAYATNPQMSNLSGNSSSSFNAESLTLPLQFPPRQPIDLPPAQTESYLRGLQWLVDMYTTGKCSDYGFSFQGSPVNMFNIVDYLNQRPQTNSLESDDDRLDLLFAGKSAMRSFYPFAANVTCALLLDAEKDVPLHLRKLWQDLREAQVMDSIVCGDALRSNAYQTLFSNFLKICGPKELFLQRLPHTWTVIYNRDLNISTAYNGHSIFARRNNVDGIPRFYSQRLTVQLFKELNQKKRH